MNVADLTQPDRDYILARLDRTHIAQIALQVRDAIHDGHAIEACYQPGDGTWYSLTFAPVGGTVGGDGGGTGGYPPSSYYGPRPLLIIYAQTGRFTAFHDHSDPVWVAAELTDSPASQLAIAQLIEAVTS